MRDDRKQTAATKQLEIANTRQARLLASRNQTDTARQLETAHIRQARLLANTATERLFETANI